MKTAFLLAVGKITVAITWIARAKVGLLLYNALIRFSRVALHFLSLGHATMCNLEFIMSTILSISLK